MRKRLGTITMVGVLAATILLACSGNPDACGSGGTKVCQADGKTCMCAPSCAGNADCEQYEVCDDTAWCEPCYGLVAAREGTTFAPQCACIQNVCLPFSWPAGSHLMLEPSNDGGFGG